MTNVNSMTCDALDAALPDYFEGTLDDAARESVEEHLTGCVRCANIVRGIESIRSEAAAMPELVPASDLWQGIEARIASPVIPLVARAQLRRRLVPAWMGVAAAALVMSTAGVTYVLTSRSLTRAQTSVASSSGDKAIARSPQTVTVPGLGGGSAQTGAATVGAPDGGPPSIVEPRVAGGEAPRAPGAEARNPSGSPYSLATQSPDPAEALAYAVYGKEIEMLQRIVARRKSQLDSSTVAIIEKNLKIIDAAIEQSRAALARDPASRMLTGQLTHALDKKVDLLRTVALLPASA